MSEFRQKYLPQMDAAKLLAFSIAQHYKTHGGPPHYIKLHPAIAAELKMHAKQLDLELYKDNAMRFCGVPLKITQLAAYPLLVCRNKQEIEFV